MTEGDQNIPPAEWAAAAVGCLLVLGAIAFFVRGALSGPASPPDLVVAVDSVTRTSAGWLVHFSAENRGTGTAAEVEIEGRSGGTETSRATLDYVPGGSTRRGGLLFTADPQAAGAPRLRATGYRVP
jgi:uncharacterized protein (TIGR02588 family)